MSTNTFYGKGARGNNTGRVLSEAAKKRKRLHSRAYDHARDMARSKGLPDEPRVPMWVFKTIRMANLVFLSSDPVSKVKAIL